MLTGDPVARAVALTEAIAAISAAAGEETDRALEEVRRQAEIVLGCDAASIHVAEEGPDGTVYRRVRLSEFALSRGAANQPLWRPQPAEIEMLRHEQTVFIPRFLDVLPPDLRERPWLREIATALYAPMVAAGESHGLLVCLWRSAIASDPVLLSTAQALARCAAIALRSARLLRDARRARAELEVVLEATSDQIVVVDATGRLVYVSRSARDGLAPLLDQRGRRAADSGLEPGDAGAPRDSPLERALRGEDVSAEIDLRSSDGQRQRLHLRAAPVASADQTLRGAVLVGRDVTALHDAIAEGARLDGAIKTARLVAHQLNNQLSLVTGYGELLRDDVEGQTADFAARILKAAEDSARMIERLQQIIRFEETDGGANWLMLDLDAATARPDAPAPGPTRRSRRAR